MEMPDSNGLIGAEAVVVETDLVVFTRSRIHGSGGFARSAIPKATRVIEYIGRRMNKQESLRLCEEGNEYIFGLNEEHDLDGNVPWNPARLINHSCAPNCDAEVEADRVWIVANRDIAAGEEVTYNYNFDLEDYKEHPCRCGSPNCVGYIVAEEFFEHVRRVMTRR
jgi:SET domain-containing protein